jgi:FG-GAP-like repeat
VKYRFLHGGLVLAVLVVAAFPVFHATGLGPWLHRSSGPSRPASGLRSFEIVPLETVSETSSNASIGDLNGDGHLDIVLVKGRHWQLTSRVFFGDGKGHFTPGPPLPSKATRSYSASLADMTKSGHLDMVLSNDQPDAKLVLVNDGNGNFTIGGTYGDPNWATRNAAVGDLNGDGYPDVAVANRGMTSYVCLNDGKLHFDCHPLENSPSAATVAIADMNGDGANDVIYACRDSCQSVVYLNDGKGNFPRKVVWGPSKASTRAMAVADFDHDGHLDIAACHEEFGCFVYLNDGKGNFGPGIQFQAPKDVPYSMTAADLNGDGLPEILVGYVNAPGMIFFNDGTGKKYQSVPFGDGKGTIYGMAAADLDGDGWTDVVVARSDAPCFVMFNRPFAKGEESTSQQPVIPKTAAPRLRRIAFEHHGFGDLLNDAKINEEEEYVNKHGRLTVEAAYDQKKVDETKKALEDFWNSRGVLVEVSTTLTSLGNRPGYASLRFDIYKK